MEIPQVNTLVPENSFDQHPKWFTVADIILKIGLVLNWLAVSTLLIGGAAGNYEQTTFILMCGVIAAFLLTILCWFISKKLAKSFNFLPALVSLLFPFLYFPIITAIWEYLETLKNFR